ncbi:MAG: alpha/beta hydrolase [Bacteroidales bacterium]|nr:alpha/beta hydrolase [Bacteroidales bacterium]
MKNLLGLVFIVLASLNVNAQKILPLYQGAIPNSKPYEMEEIEMEDNGQFFGYQKTSEPTLAVYLPDKKIATGVAVIICPGGANEFLSYKLEGIKIAEEFLSRGVAAFILKYRLPSDSIIVDKAIGPLQDAQQAIKVVREHADEWNINSRKIGIMGFSAGGHLASTAGTHFKKSYIPNNEKTSLRPDFMILVYPVISMKEGLTHIGSRVNLLGEFPGSENILLFSNELNVDKNTPPTWLTHTGDDSIVSVENSICFYQALVMNKIKAEMHLYPKGNHGFVLNLPTIEWMEPLFKWMKTLD